MRILLTSGKGASGALIRFYTFSRLAHAAFELDDGTVLDATPRHGVSVHATVAGKFVVAYTVDCEPVAAARAAEWARTQIGKPYDWSGIVGLVARRDWHNPGRWFCSELVAAAFEQAGRPLLNVQQLDRVTPRDLSLSPYLR